jgi:outer membrane protein assembly factor BamB
MTSRLPASWTALLLLFLAQAWSLPRDGRQSVEWARYLIQIEADTAQALRVLQGVLKTNRESTALAFAHALLGEIEARKNDPTQAVEHLRKALGEGKLPKVDRARILNQLLRLDPASIPSLSHLPKTPAPVSSWKALSGPGSLHALLLMTDAQNGRTRFAIQETDGKLKPMDWVLEPNQQLLDAAKNRFVVFDPESKKLSLRNEEGATLQEEVLSGRPDAVHLVNARGDALAWLEGPRLRLWRLGGNLSEYLVEAPCTLHRDAERVGSALLFCGDQNLYRADFSVGQVKPLGRLAEKPLTLLLNGDDLLLQYGDHFEIRRGPRFDAFSWGYPCQLQDRIFLSQNSLLLVSPKGGIQAFDLTTGQSRWNRDIMAQDVTPIPSGFLVLTMAHTLEALDERGMTQWSYSVGWSGEPLVQGSENDLVLFYPDSRRVHIHREGASAAQQPGNVLLRTLLAETEGQEQKRLTRLKQFLELEPGNGDAWRHRYSLEKQNHVDPKQLTFDLIQVARSGTVPAWSAHPVLKTLASQLSAKWTFKREYGPRFYPNLVTGHEFAFYVESDNQTLVILDPAQGTLVNSYRFAEDLDMKAAFWRGDTLCVSSATRLYLVSPWRRSGLLGQIPLKAPLCQALSLPQGIVTSDWQGHVRLLHPATGEVKWERQLSQGGALLGKPPGNMPDIIDVIDLEGQYFCLNLEKGAVLSQLGLGEGNPIEAHSLTQGVAVAMAQGQILMVNRQAGQVLWKRNLEEQVFNLTGNRSETLVLTTANKRVICLRALDGAILSSQHLATYLFNRPLVLGNSYWLGTTEPALEQRNFKGERISAFPLTEMPGSPTVQRDNLLVGTLDHLIFAFSIADRPN